MHSEKCPVCNGTGEKPTQIINKEVTQPNIQIPCHGCNGKGWIEVTDDKIIYIPQPYPYPNPYPYDLPWHPQIWCVYTSDKTEEKMIK
jgi:hypothetical protein